MLQAYSKIGTTFQTFDLDEYATHTDKFGHSSLKITYTNPRRPEKINAPSIVSAGIATLGPRRELRSYVLSFIEMKDDSQFDICLNVKTTCIDVDGNQHTFESVIDFSEFLGLIEIGGSKPLQNIARDLNNICTNGITINSGTKRLKVDAFNEDDRIRSDVEEEEMRRKHKVKLAQKALETDSLP